MTIDSDKAAAIAADIVAAISNDLASDGIHMPDRPLNSLQDVLYWMLMTEAVV